MKPRLVLLVLVLLANIPNIASSQSITPVPTVSDSIITLNTGPAAAGDTITIRTSKAAGACAAGNPVPLVDNTGDSVIKGGITAVMIKPNMLSAGAYLCAITTNAAGATTGTTPQVAINARAVPSISPVPTVTDPTVTILTAPAAVNDTITLFVSTTAGSCSANQTKVELVEHTGNAVRAGEKTAVVIKPNSLSVGAYLCAMMTNAAGTPTGTTPEVIVGAQAVASISPVPVSTDTTITVNTAPAAPGDTIALSTTKTAGSCVSAGTPVPLADNTGNSVLAGPKTAVVIKPNSLTAGNYLCAVMKNGGVTTGTTPEVAVGQPAPAVAVVPSISPVPAGGAWTVNVITAPAAPDDTITIFKAAKSGSCTASGTSLPFAPGFSNLVLAGAATAVQMKDPVTTGEVLCAKITNPKTGLIAATPEVVVNPGCGTPGVYSDCTFNYMLIGGIEQSDLSAQSSVTDGFFDLFLRRPVDNPWGSIWFRSRYLGAPSSSSTQNIVAAATDPTGTLVAKNLPQSVAAVDYVLGLQFDLGQIANKRLTFSPIAAFGATTPLSATTTVAGFVVPAYGTNECDQLQARFTAKLGYSPALPGSGVYDSNGDIGCVVQPNPRSSAANPLPGTQIADIAFSNEDRSSFLLKWGAGVRIIDRFSSSGSPCSASLGCSRLLADFTIGQDQAITGGHLHHLVFKADAIIPVLSTGAYFFASSANRFSRNTTLSPLILTPITITNGTGCTASSSNACLPSPSVFVLPYKQQDRDYYRIGVGIDLAKVFTKLFPASTPPPTQ
jgi:hypothetical protein